VTPSSRPRVLPRSVSRTVIEPESPPHARQPHPIRRTEPGTCQWAPMIRRSR
jgi:hypothetical protein